MGFSERIDPILNNKLADSSVPVSPSLCTAGIRYASSEQHKVGAISVNNNTEDF